MNITDLSELVELHGKAVYGFCYKLAKNEADTNDLYQDTFLKAMELCHKIDKDNNPKGFLISIAIGIWKNKCRKYAWRQKIAPIEEINEEVNNDYIFKDELTPEDVVISNELCATIQTAADTLNDKLRIPLYMYYTAGMTNEEIASALKIPLGTVKSRLYKARKVLKNILEENRYEKF
ncbi:sigma-70 family RNA polymerase sigma factor [Proteiniborus sp. MB09-C3]|uniref:RNA polymerase sigma factor n=1 Tax=Proteiniborus sp. MB09-C3 TaxID=3050072 RepID=UPI0025562AF3|nr:sigma-70 family RNA polymerase sigma factor [Proteiniborus sp. MB09-C3]WIV12402.1 sigma-70 family RNA polymerase sigma factor [Proteiniborus sp. MB09-C3]